MFSVITEYLQVNEEGTEAAAATAAIAVITSATSGPPQFVCDHPFIFFLQHRNTGMILFQGRVVNPLG